MIMSSYLYVSDRQTYIVSETKLTLTDLQEGTKTTIQVVVLSIHNLMGDVTEISTYTGNSSSGYTLFTVNLSCFCCNATNVICFSLLNSSWAG